jgi:hypothetical protein
MALDANELLPPLATPPAARRVVTSHRLVASELGATMALPQVSVVDLRLTEAEVHERAEELVARARAKGSSYSLRIWRSAHQEALLALTREASRTPASADCQTLVWAREGSLYHVSATFTARPTMVH